MSWIDWAVVGLYFLVMIAIGLWSHRQISNSSDYYVAGGRLPWWLVGISHHMSGYSSAVFVAYAALAYTEGFSVYVWWAGSIVIACAIGAVVLAPRWPRLRKRLNIVSPLEYLSTRFNLPTQQVLAWSGALLKVFDVAAKWAAAAILLQVFANVPIMWGVFLVGGVTLIYATIGGMWADVLTDLGQFIIQFVAAIVLAVVVMMRLNGLATPFTMWKQLPPGHASPFSGSLTVWFFLAYIIVSTLSYNGGTWNLAMRMMSAQNGRESRRSMIFSGALYLIWPLVLFFPMWAAPIFFPHLAEPDQSYALLARTLLPNGLIGLVLAGMFSHTMAMTASDANAISSVVVRDIIPALRPHKRILSPRTELTAARITTFVFIGLSICLALTSDRFGGVFGLLVTWFGGLVGPIAIPMLLGMLPEFRRSGPVAAMTSWVAGLVLFGLNEYAWPGWVTSLGNNGQAFSVGTPVLLAVILFIVIGLVRPERTSEADQVIATINAKEPEGQDAEAEGAEHATA